MPHGSASITTAAPKLPVPAASDPDRATRCAHMEEEADDDGRAHQGRQRTEPGEPGTPRREQGHACHDLRKGTTARDPGRRRQRAAG